MKLNNRTQSESIGFKLNYTNSKKKNKLISNKFPVYKNITLLKVANSFYFNDLT